MNYDTALRKARAGYHVKRSIWETYLRYDEKDGLVFILPSGLARALGTDYHASDKDRSAHDWLSN